MFGIQLHPLLVVAAIVCGILLSVPLSTLILKRGRKKVSAALRIEQQEGNISNDAIIVHGQLATGNRMRRLISSVLFAIAYIFGFRGMWGRLVVMALSPQSAILFLQSGNGFDVNGKFETRYELNPDAIVKVHKIHLNKVWMKMQIDGHARNVFFTIPANVSVSSVLATSHN